METTVLNIRNGSVLTSGESADYQWAHFDLNDEAAVNALNNDDSVPLFARLALSSRASRPRVEIEDDAALIILRGANLNSEEETEDMVSLRMLATPDRLITAQYRPLQTTSDFIARAVSGKGEKSVSALIAKMIAVLFTHIEDSVLSLSDQVDELEESLDADISSTSREQISDLRRKIVTFKRHLTPQREVTSRLRYSTISWIESKHATLHNENYERIMRNIDELDEMRDKLSIIKEELQTIQSEKLNRNTYVLSVVAAIFLPLGFLTGLLGINIAGMPGADYPPAFWIFCGMLIVIVILQIYVMRKKDWF